MHVKHILAKLSKHFLVRATTAKSYEFDGPAGQLVTFFHYRDQLVFRFALYRDRRSNRRVCYEWLDELLDRRRPNSLLPPQRNQLPGEWRLLDPVQENPADRIRWLVYADWLEESGREARAAFVRRWSGPCLGLLDLYLNRTSDYQEVRTNGWAGSGIYLKATQHPSFGFVQVKGVARMPVFYTTLSETGRTYRASCGLGWDVKRFLKACSKVCDLMDRFEERHRPGEEAYRVQQENARAGTFDHTAVQAELERTNYLGHFSWMTRQEADHWIAWYKARSATNIDSP